MANTGINLGLQPETLRVTLVTGADFLCTLRLNENWPGSTVLSLVFDGGVTWDATISTTDAVFSKDKADVDLIPPDTPVKLRYVNGTTDQIWAIGTVVRRG